MTIRHLTIFIRVCDEENMTRTAEKMHMTQPSISQAIAELEIYYQTKLFERLGRKLFLTAAGEKLLTYARHIVNLNLQAETEMRQFGLVYRIRLGASVTIGECMLIDLIQQLRQKYPENRITSTIHNTAVLEKMLLTDALDLALVEGVVQSEYLLATPFMNDELIFVVAPTHRLARQSQLTAKALLNEDFFIREAGSGTRSLFEKVMVANKLAYRIVGVYNNAETIKQAVAAGLGISVISRRAVRNELSCGKLCQVAIDDIVFERQFHIVHHKNKYLSGDIKKLLQICLSMQK